MLKIRIKSFILFISFCLLLVCNYSVMGQDRPNIILIMSDDMGFSDIGSYGSEISTPHLDSLAMHGLRYTQFYNTNRCAPSRASLMTGQYPHKTGMGWMPGKNYHEPGYTGDLNDHNVTIAEVLKEAGYTTFMTGKWHLSRNVRAEGSKHNWPLQRGYDKFYGILAGAGNFYDPPSLTRGNKLITPQNDPVYQPDHYYLTSAITDNSLRYLRNRSKDKPFFMYVAYTTAHWPMQAPEKEIKKYKGKYKSGWDSLRRRRYANELKLGVIDSSTTLSPLDTKPWKREKDKPAMERRMETYAAMVSIMDKGIGKIIDELKKEGTFDNTIILFLEDNGGNAEGIGYGNGEKGKTATLAKDTSTLKPLGKNEIQYAVIPPITHDGAITTMGKKVMAGPEDTYLAYLKPWANLSNTPFKQYKSFTYEGGISTPLIVHWPNGIKAPHGALRKQIGHEIDIMPTLIELGKANYPDQYKGNNIYDFSGVSLVPTFTNKSLKPRAIYWEHGGNRAMREGKWKIVSGGILKGEYENWDTYFSLPWELYNMENDRSELKDLSAQYPEKVNEMIKKWKKWAHKNNVYPMPWEKIEKPRPERPFYMSSPWDYPNF